MPTLRQRIWAYMLILTLALTVGMFGYSLQDLDFGFLILILIPGAILLMVLSLAITGSIVWYYRPFWAWFARINFGLVLILMLAFSRYFYERSKFPEEFEHVKAYVLLAVPALHDYHSRHGQYPESLSQLNLSMPIPDGLYYRHVTNAGDDNYASCELGAGKDVYCIDFAEAHLCSDGHWFVDD